PYRSPSSTTATTSRPSRRTTPSTCETSRKRPRSPRSGDRRTRASRAWPSSATTITSRSRSRTGASGSGDPRIETRAGPPRHGPPHHRRTQMMKMPRRLALAVGLLGLLGTTAGAAPAQAPAQDAPAPEPMAPSLGDVLPAFVADGLDGKSQYVDFPKGSSTV